MNSYHPCFGCQAVPVDHAIVCPKLGTISSSRHKSIRAMEADKARVKLSNKVNGRALILLRTKYWNSLYEHYVPVKADGNGTLFLTSRRGARGGLSPKQG